MKDTPAEKAASRNHHKWSIIEGVTNLWLLLVVVFNINGMANFLGINQGIKAHSLPVSLASIAMIFLLSLSINVSLHFYKKAIVNQLKARSNWQLAIRQGVWEFDDVQSTMLSMQSSIRQDPEAEKRILAIGCGGGKIHVFQREPIALPKTLGGYEVVAHYVGTMMDDDIVI